MKLLTLHPALLLTAGISLSACGDHERPPPLPWSKATGRDGEPTKPLPPASTAVDAGSGNDVSPPPPDAGTDDPSVQDATPDSSSSLDANIDGHVAVDAGNIPIPDASEIDAGSAIPQAEFGRWETDGLRLTLGAGVDADDEPIYLFEGSCASTGTYELTNGELLLRNACGPDKFSFELSEDHQELTLTEPLREPIQLSRVSLPRPSTLASQFLGIEQAGCRQNAMVLSYHDLHVGSGAHYVETRVRRGSKYLMDELLLSAGGTTGVSKASFYDADDLGRNEEVFPIPAGVVFFERIIRDATLRPIFGTTVRASCNTGRINDIVEQDFTNALTFSRFVSDRELGLSLPARTQLKAKAAPSHVTELRVLVHVKHSKRQELTLTLVSPKGTEVVLHRAAPKTSGGPDFRFTSFIDGAPRSIRRAGASAEGQFRPEEPLETFHGEQSAGDWTLIVSDDAAQSSGTLEYFSIALR